MTRFWLIRHGEPLEQAWHRCYGSLDVRLSEAGRAQITQVAECPLLRALESARILAAGYCALSKLSRMVRKLDFPNSWGRG
jgi:broad specificity phosphatase PhoE